jgi:hypothetical protein
MTRFTSGNSASQEGRRKARLVGRSTPQGTRS